MAEETKQKNIVEVKGLGNIEIVREPSPATIVDGKEKPAKPGLCKMSQSELIKFYEANGVPNAKAVLNAMSGARKAFFSKATDFLGPKVVKTMSDWELRAGLDENRLNFGIDAKREGRNVSTGEKITHYGVCWMKANAPCPISDDDKYEKLAKDVEAAFKKSVGLR